MDKNGMQDGEAPIRWTEHEMLCAVSGPDGAEGETAYQEDLAVSEFLPVAGHEMLYLRMPCLPRETPVSGGVCFYDEKKNLLKRCGTVMYFGNGGEETLSVPGGETSAGCAVKTAKLYVPAGAAYFRTTYWRPDLAASVCPDLPFAFSFRSYSDGNRPFTHTLPVCTEMNNAIKRARQLTDIRWEPLVDVPRYCLLKGDSSGQSDFHYLDFCKAGRAYTGIPYSGSGEPDRNTKMINPQTFCGRWGYYKFHVGIDVDFETFVTAARYPGSIFGERAGQTEPDFDSSPYGTYCSALVGYSLGYRQPLPKVVEFCDSENFVPVSDSLPALPPEELRLCDILICGAFHVAIITDILHDDEGKVSFIEVSEATTVGNGSNHVLYGPLGGFCRRKMWNPEALACWFRKYAVYRVLSFQGIG